MRMLFLCHSHPDLQAGGTETFSRDLFRKLRTHHGMEGIYLAGTFAGQRPGSPGTAFQSVGTATDEVLLWTGGFDSFNISQTDLYGTVPDLSSLLTQLKPQIVHVHHTMVLGMEVLPLIRRLVPAAQIVMTLHDYYAMCAHDGQLCTADGLLCAGPTLDACQRCLPARSATDFRMRELHIRGALRAVDRFVAPSDTLRDKFIAWGIEPTRIEVIRNGVPAVSPAPWRDAPDGRRDRFAFFGHVNRFKGATVALGASARLSRAGVAHTLAVHGGTAFQTEATIAQFQAALSAAPDARHAGPYQRADQGRLMAGADWVVVPSVWWENAPLVIQEAALHRRPVICSNVGGMAEAVHDERDGLHFGVGDATALAATMRRAIEEPGLWQRLANAITPPRTVQDAAAEHLTLYVNLLQAAPVRRRAA